jgi:hypothetical protein
MDGSHRSRTTTPVVRRAASLALAALALAAAPAAHAADPATDFAPGSAAAVGAADVATAYWGSAPCGGNVAITWAALAETINATSTWTNPVGAYDAPDRNDNCAITFNVALAWDWTRFCSILVHEYGHLGGRAHSSDPGDVMYPYYERPVDRCAASAPEAPADAAPTPPAAPAASPVASVARAATSSRRVKHAVLVVVRRPARHHRSHPHHRR